MNLLQRKIQEASQRYYTDGSSDLSDAEFDELVETLKHSDPNSSLLHSVGFGYDIDKDSTPGQKIAHKYGRAGSLDKCRTWEEIRSVFRNTEIDVSAKIDGLSVVLYYQSGRLYRALTRGNGDIGIDITDKVSHMLGCNISDTSFTGGVRGEIVMPLSEFTEFQAVHPEAKNPRNSAAGLINGKSISEDFKHLKIVVYSVVGWESADSGNCPYLSMYDVRNWLASQFRHTAPASKLHLDEDTYITKLQNLRELWCTEYPIDGIVLTSVATQYVPETGQVIQHSQAFKFRADVAQTVVEEVEWNLTKTRYLMPRIRVTPVTLSGTCVTFCTGYNAKYIADHSIGVGTTVEIEKRGEIIPNINTVIASTGATLPEVCPKCKHKVSWKGVHLMCTNPECANAGLQDLMIWIDNIAPIDNFGELLRTKYLQMVVPELSIEAVMQAVESNSVELPDSVGSVHRKLFYQMIDKLKSSTVSSTSAVLALNIPRFGSITAAKLASNSDLLNACACGASASEGLKYVTASEIGDANYQALKENWWKLTRLRYLKDRIIFSSAADKTLIKVAITGKLSVKRSEFASLLKAAGYEVAEISKATKFLITDDPQGNSSKNRKADALGIQKLSEQEFRDKYL